MARIRITFFFKSTRGYGWSETYFSTRGTLPQALLDAKALFPLRVNLLAAFSSLEFIRVSDDEFKRDSQIYAVPIGDQTTKLPLMGSSDIANTCLLCRVTSTDFIRRSLAMRGIPDDIVKDSGQYVPTGVWNGAFAAFKFALTAGAFAIKSRTQVGAAFNIANVGLVGPTGIVTIDTVLPHGFVSGDIVNITEVRNATQVRGIQLVLGAPTTASFDIRVKRVVRPYGGGGKVWKVGAAITAINDIIPVRISHRNAGRPFDAPRGRRLVR